MPYASLRDFIDRLETSGRLARVAAPVSPHLEMTEIQTRLLAEGGPAVLFENVTGEDGKKYSMPVLVNLFGTIERVAWGMDREPGGLREIGRTLAFLKQPEPPGGWREALELLPLLRTVMAMRPRTVGAAPCQEIVLRGAEIDLGALPVQTCWPGEPAPLITWPLVVTKGPGERREDGFNLGIYRMQVTGRDTTLMRWLKHRGGAQHHQRWSAERREPLPAAAVIGADPGTILAAVTPVPDTLSEYQFAGLLRGRKVELVDCKTVPLKVPAQAEIVLEGHVSLDEYANEGPYGDHTGYYNAVERFPVFRLSAITMRQNPIYLSTFTGRPPDEPSILGEALNEVFIPSVTAAIPGNRRFLAAARGLLLSHRGGGDPKVLPRPRQARDDGDLVVPAPIHVHEIRHRRRRRHRRARLEGCDVGDLDPHGSGARCDPDRQHPDRLPRLRLARIGSRRQNRPRRYRQIAARDPARMGPADPHGRGGCRGGDEQMGELRAARIGQADMEMRFSLGRISRKGHEMNVEHTLNLSDGHLIEIGESTWDPQNARSIRDRWPTSTGGFSPRSSSEVPMASLAPMLTFAAQHDELSAAECAEIIAELAASIRR